MDDINKTNKDSLGVIKKINKWTLVSFICEIFIIFILCLAFAILFLESPIPGRSFLGRTLDFIFVKASPTLSIFALVFGIIGLKKRERRFFSVLVVILGILLLFVAVNLFLAGVRGPR